jgi:hypothetical protein
MNTRIEKLIKQVTTIEYGVDNGFDRINFDSEKFAQLIVLECCQLVEANGVYITKSGAVKPTAPWETVKMLKAQFDIEE